MLCRPTILALPASRARCGTRGRVFDLERGPGQRPDAQTVLAAPVSRACCGTRLVGIAQALLQDRRLRGAAAAVPCGRPLTAPLRKEVCDEIAARFLSMEERWCV